MYVLRRMRFLLFFKNKCTRYDIYTAEEYQNIFSPEFIEIDNNRNSEIASLKFYPEYNQNIIEVELPRTGVLKLTDSSIIGGSNLVLFSEGKALYNENVGLNENNLDPALQTGLTAYPTIGNKRYIINKGLDNRTVEAGISLLVTYPKNYYHFTHEVLTKFWALSKLKLADDIPLIVNSEILTIPQFKELLNLFNHEKRRIISLSYLQKLKVKELYAITPIKISGGAPKDWKSVSRSHPQYNYSALDFIRNIILKNTPNITGETYERIFISRKNYSLRKYNEDEIESLLRKKGFRTIYPETLTIWEQIALFSKAKIIVAASGAALTNLLYCSPGTNIIVFLNKILSFPVYSSISHHYGSNMIYIAADKVENEKEYHTSMHINPEDLKAVLRDLGIS